MSPVPPRRVCSRCRTLVPGGQECACQRARRMARLRQQDQYRGSAHARGYDRAWRDARASLLNQRPLCAHCFEQGVVTIATQVHHVVRVRTDATRRLDAENLVPLCRRCHSRLTLAEDVGQRASAPTGGGIESLARTAGDRASVPRAQK
jgi:5-methylcytosine-specific restriction endonuclease McrA